MKVCVSRLAVGKSVSCTFSESVATRSSAQLAYHYVLMKYLSDETGYTKEEVHDAIMRLKFGTKMVRLGDKTVEVRKSVSDAAKLPKHEMVGLIEFDLETCASLGIHVPTPEQLGYISNSSPYHRPLTPVRKTHERT